ncbi:MAG: hypothetical protein ACFFAU_11565 [Candidatus Hodarchaeota archaeon]
MTSLDEILHLINSFDVISIIQVTPQRINLTVSEESFWKIIKVFGDENLVFKFIERREKSIDVHLLLSLKRNILGISFRVVGCENNFFLKIKTEFPSSKIYIQGLSGNTTV